MSEKRPFPFTPEELEYIKREVAAEDKSLSDTSHRTVITIDTLDEISDNEKELMEVQLRWLCQVHLIPLNDITIEDETK